MAYDRGRMPMETASKIAHMNVVRDANLNLLLQSFQSDVPADDGSYHPHGCIDLATPSVIKTIVSVDGGLSIVPNPVRREKTLGFAQVGALILQIPDMERIRADPMMDPREVRDLLDKVHMFQAVMPMSGVRIPGHTVKHSNRLILNSLLSPAMTGLYEVLEFLLWRKWLPTGNRPSHSISCYQCEVEFPVPSGRSFECPVCRHPHHLSDLLNLYSEDAEDWTREGSLSMVMQAIETLALFKVPERLIRQGRYDALAEILFVKDGPLMFRAGGAKLVEGIRDLIRWLVGNGRVLNLVGVEKTGEMVDFLDVYRSTLSEPGDFFFPDVKTLYEDIKGASYRGSMRNRVSYGHRIAVMLGPHHRVALQIPSRDMNDHVSEDLPVTDLIGLQGIAVTLAKVTSSQYDNAILPLTLANGAVSLSQGISTRILDDYVSQMIGQG